MVLEENGTKVIKGRFSEDSRPAATPEDGGGDLLDQATVWILLNLHSTGLDRTWEWSSGCDSTVGTNIVATLLIHLRTDDVLIAETLLHS